MHTPASAKNRLCPYRWYYTSVPTGIHQPAHGRPVSAGRCVKKPDSLKILAPCGTQASIKKLLINTGVGPRVHGPQFHVKRIRLSGVAASGTPWFVPDDPPHTHNQMGRIEVLVHSRCVRLELNRPRCLVHWRLGGHLVVPDDPPHTHIPNGAARGALCTRGCQGWSSTARGALCTGGWVA